MAGILADSLPEGDDSLLGDLFAYLEQDDLAFVHQVANPDLVEPSTSGSPDNSAYSAPSAHTQPHQPQQRPVAPQPQAEVSQLQSQLRRAGPGPKQAASTVSNQAAGNNAKGTRAKRQRDQDKIRELEALAAAKVEQFAALVRHNAELKFRSSLLAEAVTVRDYQLRLARGEVLRPPWAVPRSSAGLGATAVAAGLLPKEQAASATAGDAIRAPGSARLLIAADLERPIDMDSLCNISKGAMAAAWKAFLARAGDLLLSVEANPADEAAAEALHAAMVETGHLFRNLSVAAPDTMMAFMHTHLETEALCVPGPGHWAAVLRSLGLTAAQAADMAAIYDLFRGIMRGIGAERACINKKLAGGHHGAHHGGRGHPQPGAVNAAGPFASQAPAAPPGAPLLPAPAGVGVECEVLAALERCMRREKAAHFLVRGLVFGRTLSVLQFCRAAVHSYPWFPNATGLAAAAAGVEA